MGFCNYIGDFKFTNIDSWNKTLRVETLVAVHITAGVEYL
jgi:hypothetical protein